MKEHYKNRWLGFILAMIGAVLGIGVNVIIFFTQYNTMIAAQLAQYPSRTNWMIITYLLPVWAGMGVVAGFLYVVALYGFNWKTKDAYKLSMIANVIALQFSFWPQIPALDTGLTPWYAIVFLPNIVIFFLLNLLVGKKNILRVLFCLITGMSLVMSVINGTASLNIFWMRGEMFYRIANPIHWLCGLGFGILTLVIMLSPKNWNRILAIIITIIEIGVGGYMGIVTTIQKGEFSMYLGAPGLSILILLVVAIPKFWNFVIKPERS